MLTDGRAGVRTDEKPDPYIWPCLRQARQKSRPGSKLDHYTERDLLYGKIKFSPLGFKMGKGENVHFFFYSMTVLYNS